MVASKTASVSTISFVLGDAKEYGTTREEYKLWVDYIFDWFHGTLERRFRRYLIAAGFAALVWLVGLAVVAPFGLAELYVTTPGFYLFLIGIAWCFNALRWLSQVYHLRTNRVRPCFPVPDSTYKTFVTPFAQSATNNRAIFARSIPIILAVWLYMGFVTFSTGRLGAALLVVYPPTFSPQWHSGANALVKMGVLDFYWAVTVVHVYTGSRLTLSTTPLYSRMLSLPIVPLPGLVSELFQGILDLYLAGAFMWSFGIVLAELLYEAHIDLLSIGFIFTVTALGLFAYVVPRRAVNRLSTKAKDEALDGAIKTFYQKARTDHSVAEITELNEYVNSILANESAELNRRQLLDLVVGQLLPALPLLLNTLVAKHLPFLG